MQNLASEPKTPPAWTPARWTAFIPKRMSRATPRLNCCTSTRSNASTAAPACRFARSRRFSRWTTCRKSGRTSPPRTPHTTAGRWRTLCRSPRPAPAPTSRGCFVRAPADLVVEVFGHVFGGRVEHVEWREVVQVLVIQPVHYRLHQLLHRHKIHQQPDGIQLRTAERQLHPVVVAMHVFAFAFVIPQRVSGGEGLFHGNFKH